MEVEGLQRPCVSGVRDCAAMTTTCCNGVDTSNNTNVLLTLDEMVGYDKITYEHFNFFVESPTSASTDTYGLH
jgi:hypothetical protein